MKRFRTQIADLICANHCELCGEVIVMGPTRCEGCLKAERITGKTCPKCGCEESLCNCKKRKFTPEYKAVCAPFYYSGSIVNAVHRFKFFGYTELAKPMAAEIAKTVSERFEGVNFDYVTFIPMTFFKKRKRGYNQSRILAKRTAKELGVKFKILVYKRKHTRSQRKSNEEQRRVNLYDAFRVAKFFDVTDKTILVIDDVKTTGSTLSEVAFALKNAGAKQVYAAAFTATRPHEYMPVAIDLLPKNDKIMF